MSEEDLALQQLLKFTPPMLSIVEPDGRFTWVNEAVLEYFDISLADLNDMPERRVHPADAHLLLVDRQKSLAKGDAFESEQRLRRKDGQYRWFLVRYRPAKDAAGRIVRWYGSATDIEDQKRAEFLLRRSEAYLAQAQRLSHTGSWAYRAAAGNVVPTHWSEEMYRIWGFDPAEGVPTAEMIRQRIHPEDRDRASTHGPAALRDNKDYSMEFRILLPGGEVRYIRSFGRPVVNTSENCIEMVGTHVDITESKLAEEERARLRLWHLVREFALSLEVRVAERTRIARELHDTLLQGFQGVLLHFQAVLELLPTRPADARQFLVRAIDRAAKALTEARDAVQGLRTAADGANDLVAMIKALGEELAAIVPTNHAVPVHVAVEGTIQTLHPLVRDEVYRISAEAIRNAIQHSRGSQIEVELRYEEQQFRLRVRDDGNGIDPEVLAQGGREGHYGLRGMRERAELVGGGLTVTSRIDTGTEVEFAIASSRAYAIGEPREKD